MTKDSYPLDQDNLLHIEGWGVYRNAPWHLAGFFPSQAEAEVLRSQLGEGYVVAFGSKRLASDDFMTF